MEADAPLLYISLVGGQAAPILLGILRDGQGSPYAEQHGRPRYPSQVHLLYTNISKTQLPGLVTALHPAEIIEDTEAGDLRPFLATDGIRSLALGEHTLSLSTQLVDAYDDAEVASAVTDAIASYGEGKSVRVDITPASKLMALGAYFGAQTASELDPDRVVEVQYVNSELARHLSRTPGHPTNRHDFPMHFPELTVDAIAAAYGFTLKTGTNLFPPALTESARSVASAILASQSTMDAIQGFKQQPPVVARATVDAETAAIFDQAASLQVLESNGAGWQPANNFPASEFWKGTWLEYATAELLQSLQSEESLPRGIQHGKQMHRIPGTGGALAANENECDVLAVVRHRILIAECKSKLNDSGEVNEAIDKLQGVRRRLGGTYALAFLIVGTFGKPTALPTAIERCKRDKIELLVASDPERAVTAAMFANRIGEGLGGQL